MKERKLRQKIRQIITEESDEDEEVIQGEEHDEEEDVEERVGVENVESGNYYNVKKSHALNNPQKYNKIREVVRKHIKEEISEIRKKGKIEEAAGRRELRNLQDWLGDIKDITNGGLDDRLAEKIADRMDVTLADEVFVEPIDPQTVNQLVRNPDVELEELGNDMIAVFFGPDNPGLEGFEKFVAIGKSQGMRPFWLLYAKKYAK